jgi:predicted NUDIX family phosphoesterase
MAQEEQVLVIERTVFDALGSFQGISFDVDTYFPALLTRGTPRFIPRSSAEHDPTYKQIIPYVLLSCGDRFLCYVRGRRSGETRLVGLRSMGIGGHINPVDDMPLFNSDFQEAYRAAVEREVAEEIAVDCPHTDRIVAIINDDSTEVGQVHLGIVHHWVVDEAKVAKREQMITRLAFMSPRELNEVAGELESWSALCLQHVARVANHPSASPKDD